MEGFEQINAALESWLDQISVLEERQQIVSNFHERIIRTLQQIQIEGLLPFYDFAVLNYIGETWLQLLNNVSAETIDKRCILQNLLKLYNANQISEELLIEIAVQL